MKIVIADSKTGKCYGIDVPKDKESEFIGKKIGDKVEGGIVGAEGFELEITGGSDSAGFPMRSDVSGPRRVPVIVTGGTGIRKKSKGKREMKSVRGNVISDEIVQVNAKVTGYGSKPLEELFPKAAGGEKKK